MEGGLRRAGDLSGVGELPPMGNVDIHAAG